MFARPSVPATQPGKGTRPPADSTLGGRTTVDRNGDTTIALFCTHVQVWGTSDVLRLALLDDSPHHRPARAATLTATPSRPPQGHKPDSCSCSTLSAIIVRKSTRLSPSLVSSPQRYACMPQRPIEGTINTGFSRTCPRSTLLSSPRRLHPPRTPPGGNRQQAGKEHDTHTHAHVDIKPWVSACPRQGSGYLLVVLCYGSGVLEKETQNTQTHKHTQTQTNTHSVRWLSSVRELSRSGRARTSRQRMPPARSFAMLRCVGTVSMMGPSSGPSPKLKNWFHRLWHLRDPRASNRRHRRKNISYGRSEIVLVLVLVLELVLLPCCLQQPTPKHANRGHRGGQRVRVCHLSDTQKKNRHPSACTFQPTNSFVKDEQPKDCNTTPNDGKVQQIRKQGLPAGLCTARTAAQHAVP